MQKSLMLFTHYLLGYVGTVIYSIGLVLALCSVYIFTRRQMRSAVSTYLAGLSISDSCLLSLGLVFAINSSIPPSQQSESFYSSYVHKHLFPYVYACIVWFQFTSVWITIGFAVDRWFAIKWPMLHYTYSSKRACYIVLAIYGLGFLYSLPRFFEYKTEVQRENLTIIENYTESFTYLVVKNELRNNTFYQYTVHLTLKSLFQSLIPLLMLSYFNVELIRSVNASSHFLQRYTPTYGQTVRNGRETSIIRYRETTITRSVICLIGLFIICQVPASILNYIYMFYRNHPWLYICYDISNFLVLLNSAVNFFIFTFFNRKFRRELARVCFRTINRSRYLRTSSQQFLKRTSSNIRLTQQTRMDVIHPDYRLNQKRINHGSTNPTRKKSSESEDHLSAVCDRSDSSTYVRSMNNTQLKYSRYAVCELQMKTSSFIQNEQQKSSNCTYPKIKRKSKAFDQRRYSERYLYVPKKYSLSSNTSAVTNTRYISCKSHAHHQKLSGQFSSTTITSNLTRSTMEASSGSSFHINQNQFIKTVSNDLEQSSRLYRK